MISALQAPQIERKDERSSLVLWLCEPFNRSFSFRPIFEEIERVLGRRRPAAFDLPPEEPNEDFIDGALAWGDTAFAVYFQRSLGYAEFSTTSADQIDALLDALAGSISTGWR